MTDVSVALATFNGERHLLQQLESLACQSQLPAELIICDDGSADRTIEIAREFANSAPFPVHIFCNETRLGFRANFMRAADRCTSDLIAFCDQDDVWEPEKIAAMQRVFDDPRVLLAYHNASIVRDDGKCAGRMFSSSSATRLFAPLAIPPWFLVKGFTQVFRRDLVRFSRLNEDSIDPYWPAERMAHDQWYLFLASVLGNIIRVPTPLAQYRQHDANTFGWRGRKWILDVPRYILTIETWVRGMARAAKSRVDILHRLQDRVTEDQRTRVGDAIAYYEALHRLLNDRIAVYASQTLFARLKAFYRLVKQGAYGRMHGSMRLGWDDLLLDVYIGIPFGPFMKRFAPPEASVPKP